MIRQLVGLDFETYGSVDLKTHGLMRYTEDEFFRPLIYSTFSSDGNISQLFYGDFIKEPEEAMHHLKNLAASTALIVAHNAGFERRVLEKLGIYLPAWRFVDSAAVARAAGADEHLANAAPQLLGTNKLESGTDLIKLFSIPSKEQREQNRLEFDTSLVLQHPEKWDEFHQYCSIDAKLGYLIVDTWAPVVSWWKHEQHFSTLTMDMNFTGWPVDLDLVWEMRARDLDNQSQALDDFILKHDAADLNLNSLKQLKEWCGERGIRATSFDEQHVQKMLERIESSLWTGNLPKEKFDNYSAVADMLRTKQLLGGSGLKKLVKVLDTVASDNRLYDQYVHTGAGATRRTSGRGAQLQNLKRIGDEPADMSQLFDQSVTMSNELLGKNIRQIFTASNPNGKIIVGDLSSIESRGLAWQANAAWKLNAYYDGVGLYELQAAQIYGVHYNAVTKAQRQTGKIGELSCGYQAGPGAVKDFAEKLGVALTEAEAGQIVNDWRSANPEIVAYWDKLHDALEGVMSGTPTVSVFIGPVGLGAYVAISRVQPPPSLAAQHPGVISLQLDIYTATRTFMTRRLIHGLYRRGKDICYYKPSGLRSGDLWKNHFRDPKTKQVRFYNIYGGKLAGILTQSLCRELFFHVTSDVAADVVNMENVKLFGQFHDELVLEWEPGPADLPSTLEWLEDHMSRDRLQGFPMAAEVKHAYRYIK